MKLLFVPCSAGVLPHGIPLVALSRREDLRNDDRVFLVPKNDQRLMAMLEVPTLPIDHDIGSFATEFQAYDRFQPDVVIHDMSFTTPFAAKMRRIPAISILRTGTLPGDDPAFAALPHSLAVNLDAVMDVTRFGIAQPRSFYEYFRGDANIVPAIPAIEPLPTDFSDSSRIFYSGPLLTDDRLALAPADGSPAVLSSDFSPLDRFFDRCSGRKIVYLTLGTVAILLLHRALPQCIARLLAEGVAVVTNIKCEAATSSEWAFHARFLPMHYVTQRCDLVIHHCGSGTYQYALLHRRPTLTVGTMRRDREQVAVRLQELGVSVHLGAPDDSDEFVDRFTAAALAALQRPANVAAQDAIRDEIERTRDAFRMRDVIDAALA